MKAKRLLVKDWPMIYDIKIDEFRPVTQKDVNLMDQYIAKVRGELADAKAALAALAGRRMK